MSLVSCITIPSGIGCCIRTNLLTRPQIPAENDSRTSCRRSHFCHQRPRCTNASELCWHSLLWQANQLRLLFSTTCSATRRGGLTSNVLWCCSTAAYSCHSYTRSTSLLPCTRVDYMVRVNPALASQMTSASHGLCFRRQPAAPQPRTQSPRQALLMQNDLQRVV